MPEPAFTLCRSCGKGFSGGTQAFDDHRTGTYSPDARRCLTEAEMRALGCQQDAAGRWSRKAPKALRERLPSP